MFSPLLPNHYCLLLYHLHTNVNSREWSFDWKQKYELFCMVQYLMEEYNSQQHVCAGFIDLYIQTLIMCVYNSSSREGLTHFGLCSLSSWPVTWLSCLPVYIGTGWGLMNSLDVMAMSCSCLILRRSWQLSLSKTLRFVFIYQLWTRVKYINKGTSSSLTASALHRKIW